MEVIFHAMPVRVCGMEEGKYGLWVFLMALPSLDRSGARFAFRNLSISFRVDRNEPADQYTIGSSRVGIFCPVESYPSACRADCSGLIRILVSFICRGLQIRSRTSCSYEVPVFNARVWPRRPKPRLEYLNFLPIFFGNE